MGFQVGYFYYLSLLLLGTAACMLSIEAVTYCDFVSRYVVLTPAGSSYCKEQDLNEPADCQVFLHNHSLGFYGFQGTLPSSTGYTCFTYKQVMDGKPLWTFLSFRIGRK